MRAFFRKDEQIPGSATWLRTWRPHVRVVPGAPVNESGSGQLHRSRFSSFAPLPTEGRYRWDEAAGCIGAPGRRLAFPSRLVHCP